MLKKILSSLRFQLFFLLSLKRKSNSMKSQKLRENRWLTKKPSHLALRYRQMIPHSIRSPSTKTTVNIIKNLNHKLSE